MNKKITYFGILKSLTSWSKVSRELISSLISQGTDINIFERKGFLYNASFPLDYTINNLVTNKFEGDIVFTFENPKVYSYLPKQCYKIGFLVYEFTVLPESWIENIEKHLDLVVVPSEFCKDVFINSGINKKKMKILRFGYNPQYYFPSGKKMKKDRFEFLCVAAPHKREGLDILLESYRTTFTSKDDVNLTIKLTYLPGNKPRSFEYTGIGKSIQKIKDDPGAPAIKLITDSLDEMKMGDLYRNSDCYISLSKSEAFGLCFLEALACGKKVVAVNWSGQSDFLNDKNTCFVKHSLTKTTGEEYESVNKDLYIALPDKNHASEVMRQMKNEENCSVMLNQYQYYWDTIAGEFRTILSNI